MRGYAPGGCFSEDGTIGAEEMRRLVVDRMKMRTERPSRPTVTASFRAIEALVGLDRCSKRPLGGLRHDG